MEPIGKRNLIQYLAFLLIIAFVAGSSPDHVLILSRHGVRRQFPSKVFDFSKYAPGKDFLVDDSDWGVEEGLGVLTRHGYDAVERMGDYQGQRYSKLSSIKDCNSVFIYSEENMPRDVKTAEAFFNGFQSSYASPTKSYPLRSCGPFPMTHENADLLIDQGSKPRNNGKCRLGNELEIKGRVGYRPEEYTRLYSHQLDRLSALLGCCDASLCPPGTVDANGKCQLGDLPSSWDPDPGHWYDTFLGPVYAGKYFSEWFLLSYLNGMDYYWGQSEGAEEVVDLASFVTLYRAFEFDLLAAKPFGSTLLLHILATLQQWAAGPAATATAINYANLAHPPQAGIVYYAAHDTNLLYIGELLGLKWLNRGWQENHTPPGGALVIEYYHGHSTSTNTGTGTGTGTGTSSAKQPYIKVFFDTATPEQIRNLTPLQYDRDDDSFDSFDSSATDGTTDTRPSTPGRAPVTVPGCTIGHTPPQGDEGLAGVECPLSVFASLVLKNVDWGCITVPALEAFATELAKTTPTTAASPSSPSPGHPPSPQSAAAVSISPLLVFLSFVVGCVLTYAVMRTVAMGMVGSHQGSSSSNSSRGRGSNAVLMRILFGAKRANAGSGSFNGAAAESPEVELQGLIEDGGSCRSSVNKRGSGGSGAGTGKEKGAFGGCGDR